MPIKLQLHNNTEVYEYQGIKDIPKEFYSQIQVFKCNNCNLDNIDFIANFINIRKLNASCNKIKLIPIVSCIEEIEIYNNELEEFPPITNLKILYAFNNKIKKVHYLPNLELADISHNNIKTLSCSPKLEKLFISHNNLTSLLFKGNNITELECNNNYLKDINFIHGLDKLKKINYDNNPINILPVHIKRYLPNNNYNIITNSKHTLDKDSIQKILKIINNYKNINVNYNLIKNEIIKIKIISEDSQRSLKKYTDEKYIEPIIRLSYLELFFCYWNFINNFSNNFDKKSIIYQKLNEILSMKECNCISCLFKNLSSIN